VSVTEGFAVYGFATTHDALMAEAALEGARVPATTIPAPRELGSLCGLAMRVLEVDAHGAEAAMMSAGVSWTGRVGLEDRVPRGSRASR